MVYFCETADILEQKPELIKYLPIERRQKLERLRGKNDKNNSLIAWLLLMYALKKPYLPDFSYYERGKPYFKELPDIHFSISHCKTGVVVVISDKPIGVDIQDIRPFNRRTAERVCNEAELEFLLNSEDKACEFTKLWAIKESILKQSGAGIFGSIKNAISNCKLPIKTYCYEKHIISVCRE